jgi:Protein of unknown function (DUF3300)
VSNIYTKHCSGKTQAIVDDNQAAAVADPGPGEEGGALLKRIFTTGVLLAAVVCFSAFLPIQARAQEQGLTYSVSFTEPELDDLLGPIALYPDPLLAQMLPASTYPDEIADAAAWLNSGGDASSIDEQVWDESVKSIAHYPGILQMMAGNLDWTANVGDAFINQPEDVTNSIQRLRWRARAAGNLVSNSEQSVIIDGDYIQIDPAQPQYMYLPQYDPSVVYIGGPGPGAPPYITFGLGLVIGGWLAMDFDWGHHHVIYHGWNRPGWVNHARPYVNVNNVYMSRSRPLINETWRHDGSHGDPARYLASRPSGPKTDWHTRTGEIAGRTAVQTKPAGGMFGPQGDTRSYSNRGSESRGIVVQQRAPLQAGVSPRPSVPAPNFAQRPATHAPGVSEGPVPVPPRASNASNQPEAARRESPQPGRTPSVTFGGYRGTQETREHSTRGQASRQSAEKARPSEPSQSHGRAPAGGNVPRDGQSKQR